MWMNRMIGLGRWPWDVGRDGCRDGQSAGIHGEMSILVRIQGHQLRELAVQNLGMATQVVYHDLRRLLIFREITTLMESSRPRRVHEKVGRASELHNETARVRRRAAWLVGNPMLKGDVLDVGERELDLVSCRVVVDVIGQARFLRSVKDDEIHRVLANATPRADAQRLAMEMVYHC